MRCTVAKQVMGAGGVGTRWWSGIRCGSRLRAVLASFPSSPHSSVEGGGFEPLVPQLRAQLSRPAAGSPARDRGAGAEAAVRAAFSCSACHSMEPIYQRRNVRIIAQVADGPTRQRAQAADRDEHDELLPAVAPDVAGRDCLDSSALADAADPLDARRDLSIKLAEDDATVRAGLAHDARGDDRTWSPPRRRPAPAWHRGSAEGARWHRCRSAAGRRLFPCRPAGGFAHLRSRIVPFRRVPLAACLLIGCSPNYRHRPASAPWPSRLEFP
jgi:hypothetical protein